MELLEEPREESARVLRVYRELLAGRQSAEETWRELNARSQLGVTRGTLTDG